MRQRASLDPYRLDELHISAKLRNGISNQGHARTLNKMGNQLTRLVLLSASIPPKGPSQPDLGAFDFCALQSSTQVRQPRRVTGVLGIHKNESGSRNDQSASGGAIQKVRRPNPKKPSELKPM